MAYQKLNILNDKKDSIFNENAKSIENTKDDVEFEITTNSSQSNSAIVVENYDFLELLNQNPSLVNYLY